MKTDQKLRAIVAEVLQISVEPEGDLQRLAIAAWDSLAHLRLVMVIEEEFGVRFETEEVTSIGSLSDISRLLETKVPSAA
jgi:acyl carrier protein